MEPLTIGKVARLAGVGIEAIRFYEREGLIAEPPRRESGYRQYSEDASLRLRFIQRAKALGFSLKEIKELLSLRIHPDASCEEVRERAETKIADIEGRMETLKRMKHALADLVSACRGRGPVRACPILNALDDGNKVKGQSRRTRGNMRPR